MFRELVEILAREPSTISNHRLAIEALARAGHVSAPVPVVLNGPLVVDA
jgi:hypothetical protein